MVQRCRGFAGDFNNYGGKLNLSSETLKLLMEGLQDIRLLGVMETCKS